MNNPMYDFRQAHRDRLEDAGIIKYGEHAHTSPRTERSTLRDRFTRSLRDMFRSGGR